MGGTAYKCALIDLRTGQEILLPSIAAARKYINMSSSQIYYRAQKTPCIIEGFKLERR